MDNILLKYLFLFVVTVTVGVNFFQLAMAPLNALTHPSSPQHIAEYRLSLLNDDSFINSIQRSVDEGQFELAKNQISVAEEFGKNISKTLVDAANPTNFSKSLRAAKDGFNGALTGTSSNSAEMSGALISDLSGIGDLRDILIQGKAFAQDKPYDPIILGLSCAGLVLTGGTFLSIGSLAPADAGASIIKTAHRGNHLSKPLRTQLVRISTELVDLQKLQKAIGSISILKPTASITAIKRVLNPNAMKVIANLSNQTSIIAKNGGLKSASLALRHSDNIADISKFSLISKKYKKRSAAVFSLLGKSAITLAGLSLILFSWAAALIFWAMLVSYSTYKILRGCIRLFKWSRLTLR